MRVLVQQELDEYAADQARIAELEDILAQPQPNPFALEAGKEVVVLRNEATSQLVAGKRGVILEVREPNGTWVSEMWPVVVHLDGDNYNYLFARNEVAVVG